MIHVQPPHKNWQDDDGSLKRLYPVEDEPEIESIKYSKEVQRTSIIMGEIVGAFTDWMKSFFPPNYFKQVRVRNQAAYGEFKSFMKDIYKKEKPFMVISSDTIDQDPDSLFAQNMINRYNMYDPSNENIGAQMIYSLDILKTDKCHLAYRRNRYLFDFQVLIMEQTQDRQLSTYNKLLMSIRHNSKFMITRVIPMLIPDKHIQIIAHMHDFDYKSPEFLDFLNAVSRYPIIKRINPNNQIMFFMEQEINIRFDVPNLPGKDSPEMSAAIEWGARLTDDFMINVDLPSEYLLLVPEQYFRPVRRFEENTPENIGLISPVYADLDWPKEVDGYQLSNRIDVMIQETDDPSMNIIDTIASFDPDIYQEIKKFIAVDGPLGDLIKVKVFPNGSYEEALIQFDNDGTLTLLNPMYDKLYSINIYLNLQVINMIREGTYKKFIGTIEKY